ncbi:O-antigen ligase like membrane protein [Caloramator proteoclasticus DSM 10124]|uniref:O-antigen ligase like membrane protein n=2 Tax=Caloramator TaxID=44258 RepID=A0A1M4WLT5_9CLOT|nr:O-antigen ligase like membrane protein [Caloramator proteoclasticus DSM 10124]
MNYVGYKNISIKLRINSLLIALFFCANIMTTMLPKTENIIVKIMAVLIIIYIINNKTVRIISISKVLIISLILFYFGISYWLICRTYELYFYFLSFIFFGITGLIMSDKNKFSLVYVFKYLVVISAVLSFKILNINFINLDYGQWMGFSYNMLAGISASIICLTSIKIEKVYKLISFWVLISYGYIYFNYASRGVILALLIQITGMIYLKIEKNIKYRKIIFFIGLLMLVFIYLNMEQILMNLNNFLSTNNIKFYAIDKAVMYLNQNDISNGRMYLWNEAIRAILQAPITGNGIAYFESVYGTYVHNLFIQLLYEGGVVFFTIFSLLIFYPIKILLFDNEVEYLEKIFFIFLITNSIVQLFFSNTLWRVQQFWFYIGYTISFFIIKHRDENKLSTTFQKSFEKIIESKE